MQLILVAGIFLLSAATAAPFAIEAKGNEVRPVRLWSSAVRTCSRLVYHAYAYSSNTGPGAGTPQNRAVYL